MGKSELQSLIEEHRLARTGVRIIRTIGNVQRHETHSSAHDPGFAATLAWGGIECP